MASAVQCYGLGNWSDVTGSFLTFMAVHYNLFLTVKRYTVHCSDFSSPKFQIFYRVYFSDVYLMFLMRLLCKMLR